MNKFKIIKSMLMNLPVSLTMSFVAQWINIRHGHMPHFDWGSMAVSFCFSYFIAFLIAFFIPADQWGFALAEKCNAKRGTWAFDILVNLVVNTVFCVIMTAVMHTFTACVLGGLPLSTLPSGFAEMIGPVWISCFIVSLLTQRPAMNLAKRLCGMKN
ncbi:MAG: hypothetical protein IJ242_00545 [Clostridia bacterium]|nr:hypothetical protein [Clostridia bacterium]